MHGCTNFQGHEDTNWPNIHARIEGKKLSKGSIFMIALWCMQIFCIQNRQKTKLSLAKDTTIHKCTNYQGHWGYKLAKHTRMNRALFSQGTQEKLRAPALLSQVRSVRVTLGQSSKIFFPVIRIISEASIILPHIDRQPARMIMLGHEQGRRSRPKIRKSFPQ